MQIDRQFHLTYCTNVHPGADWKTTFAALEAHLVQIRTAVSPNAPFGLGLRLSDKASRELDMGNQLDLFADWLRANDIYVFTMNGFPYGNFHGQPVKDQVHFPDWTTSQRWDYTDRLFRQLAYLLPEGMEGGISTSPVSYRHWHKTEIDRDQVLRTGAQQMAKIALQLVNIETQTGKYLHLDIEPEPDGMLEKTADVLEFFHRFLIPEGTELLVSVLGVTEEAAKALLLRHLTLCYDVCHFALAFEDPQHVFSEMEKAGIRIGKIQVSAALRIPEFVPDNTEIISALQAYNEPVYLHQVTTKTENGVKTWSDLPELFKEKQSYGELRAHFHVPIFSESFGVLGATQREILEVVDYIKAHPICKHLEVETYTWEVLPGHKDELSRSISRELLWLHAHLKE
jgi:hypothetical protein